MIEFFEEKLEECLPEMKALLQKHWNEVGFGNDRVSLDPDYDRYTELERSNKLQLVVARDNQVMVGYCLDIVDFHLHHRCHQYAVNDILYLIPEHRGGLVAPAMLEVVQGQLRHKGVSAHIITMMDGYGFKGTADDAGYKPLEQNYGKFL